MDSTATNYNPAATSEAGATCTYPIVVTPPSAVIGCMDSTATNFNPAATSQSGVACTYPVVTPPGGGGGGAGGGAGGGGGGGGGGGAAPAPTVMLSALLHAGVQPLAYLYLSQIPYTGLNLGPRGTVLYWLVLIGFALAAAYFVLFTIAPRVNNFLCDFGARVLAVLNEQRAAAVPAYAIPAAPAPVASAPIFTLQTAEAPRGYSTYHGFKSFAHNGALSIDDIVKSLSRQRPAPVAPVVNVEPIQEKVEPIYENVELIATAEAVAPAPASMRGFIAALLEGDRAAVFAGLRQHVRGAGAPEELITEAVCLLDDVYRARIDGTVCDPDIARLAARLSTPVLEKLIAALATAIDASYSTGVTGAKLALTRALTILGA